MTPRELAELIRRGAKIRPQCTGYAFKDGGSCALGAAYEAKHGRIWPENDWSNFPLYEIQAEGVSQVDIFTKNDSGMTREAIADWLDTLEPETKPADKQSFDAFMATVMKPVPVNSLVFHSD